MSQGPARDAVGAGALLIAAIVAFAAVVLGAGALLGMPKVLTTGGGGVAGAGVGFWIVRNRFKQL